MRALRIAAGLEDPNPVRNGKRGRRPGPYGPYSKTTRSPKVELAREKKEARALVVQAGGPLRGPVRNPNSVRGRMEAARALREANREAVEAQRRQAKRAKKEAARLLNLQARKEREAARRIEVQNNRRKVPCEVCGKLFPIRRCRGDDPNRCCSRECGFELARDTGYIHWYFRNCKQCGLLFKVDAHHQSTCSPECRRQREATRYESRKPTGPIFRTCAQCGIQIIVVRKRGPADRLCKPCALVRKQELRKEHGKHFRERARNAGVPYAHVNVKDVVKRHGSLCSICGEEIDLHATDPKLRMSIDHVVPMALGGWHDLINLRPAHLKCNSAKGVRFTGQLMLRMKPRPRLLKIEMADSNFALGYQSHNLSVFSKKV